MSKEFKDIAAEFTSAIVDKIKADTSNGIKMGGNVMSIDFEEIAAELTLAIADRIKPVDTSSDEAMNKSLAREVAGVYSIIYATLKELSIPKNSKNEVNS